MKKNWTKGVKAVLTAMMLVLVAGPIAASAAEEGLRGWEADSEYNTHYQVAEFDEWKGYVQEVVEIQPLKGMDPGIGLIVDSRDGERVQVHLGPKPFVEPRLRAMNVSPADLIRFKGAWAYFGDEEVFIASKMTKNEQQKMKTRFTSDGKPFWMLPPEELAREEAEM